jgi:hypothetical protein
MANLFNIDARFGEVMQLDSVIAEFDRLATRDDLSPNGETPELRMSDDSARDQVNSLVHL